MEDVRDLELIRITQYGPQSPHGKIIVVACWAGGKVLYQSFVGVSNGAISMSVVISEEHH